MLPLLRLTDFRFLWVSHEFTCDFIWSSYIYTIKILKKNQKGFTFAPYISLILLTCFHTIYVHKYISCRHMGSHIFKKLGLFVKLNPKENVISLFIHTCVCMFLILVRGRRRSFPSVIARCQ